MIAANGRVKYDIQSIIRHLTNLDTRFIFIIINRICRIYRNSFIPCVKRIGASCK